MPAGIYVVEQVRYELNADDRRVFTGGVDSVRGRVEGTKFLLNGDQLRESD